MSSKPIIWCWSASMVSVRGCRHGGCELGPPKRGQFTLFRRRGLLLVLISWDSSESLGNPPEPRTTLSGTASVGVSPGPSQWIVVRIRTTASRGRRRCPIDHLSHARKCWGDFAHPRRFARRAVDLHVSRVPETFLGINVREQKTRIRPAPSIKWPTGPTVPEPGSAWMEPAPVRRTASWQETPKPLLDAAFTI